MARMQGFQNRRKTDDVINDFPTPPWATRALIQHILPDDLSEQTVWEPSANRGHMVRPLAEAFATVIASDLVDYGVGFPVVNFLDGPSPTDFGQKVDWIITNPPFVKAEEFVQRALEVADYGVAVFVRASWIEGKRRYASLFRPNPPTIVAPFVERVPLVAGRLDRKAVTQMPYAWAVWMNDGVVRPKGQSKLIWIPPSRKDMEQDYDYPTEH